MSIGLRVQQLGWEDSISAQISFISSPPYGAASAQITCHHNTLDHPQSYCIRAAEKKNVDRVVRKMCTLPTFHTFV